MFQSAKLSEAQGDPPLALAARPRFVWPTPAESLERAPQGSRTYPAPVAGEIIRSNSFSRTKACRLSQPHCFTISPLLGMLHPPAVTGTVGESTEYTSRDNGTR